MCCFDMQIKYDDDARLSGLTQCGHWTARNSVDNDRSRLKCLKTNQTEAIPDWLPSQFTQTSPSVAWKVYATTHGECSEHECYEQYSIMLPRRNCFLSRLRSALLLKWSYIITPSPSSLSYSQPEWPWPMTRLHRPAGRSLLSDCI